MKATRSRKHMRKRQRPGKHYTAIGINLFAIMFLLFLAVNQLTSPTTAYFLDTARTSGSIVAADSFGQDNSNQDKYSIHKVKNQANCSKIYATFENKKDGDANDLTYKVKNKNQNKTVDTGTVTIQGNDSATFDYSPNKSAKYKFIVNKESGNEGSVASDWISFTKDEDCESPQQSGDEEGEQDPSGDQEGDQKPSDSEEVEQKPEQETDEADNANKDKKADNDSGDDKQDGDTQSQEKDQNDGSDDSSKKVKEKNANKKSDGSEVDATEKNNEAKEQNEDTTTESEKPDKKNETEPTETSNNTD